MTTHVVTGGRYIIGRRMKGNASATWEINDKAFRTLEAAQAAVADMPDDYEYSIADANEIEAARKMIIGKNNTTH